MVKLILLIDETGNECKKRDNYVVSGSPIHNPCAMHVMLYQLSCGCQHWYVNTHDSGWQDSHCYSSIGRGLLVSCQSQKFRIPQAVKLSFPLLSAPLVLNRIMHSLFTKKKCLIPWPYHWLLNSKFN